MVWKLTYLQYNICANIAVQMQSFSSVWDGKICYKAARSGPLFFRWIFWGWMERILLPSEKDHHGYILQFFSLVFLHLLQKKKRNAWGKLNEYTGECRPPSRPNSPPTSRKFRGSSKITVFNTRCHECSQQFVWLFGHTFAVCPDSGSKRKIMGLPASIAFFI